MGAIALVFAAMAVGQAAAAPAAVSVGHPAVAVPVPVRPGDAGVRRRPPLGMHPRLVVPDARPALPDHPHPPSEP